ncbi:RNA-directed DNA polymerase, eukaryota [Tanacetum coccineum]
MNLKITSKVYSIILSCHVFKFVFEFKSNIKTKAREANLKINLRQILSKNKLRNLSRRGVLLDSHLCPLCNAAMEDVQHVFFRCDVARVVLRKICRWWDLDWQEICSFSDWDAWFLSFRLSSRLKSILEAKILANRLVGVLGDIVNEVQSAFISDRQILDGLSFLMRSFNGSLIDEKAGPAGRDIIYERQEVKVLKQALKLLMPRIYDIDNIKVATICMKLNEPCLENNFRRSIRGGIRAVSSSCYGLLHHSDRA